MTEAPTTGTQFESPILDLAALALRAARFSVERLRSEVDAPEVLVAENEYFILAVAVGPTAASLVRLESQVVRILVDRVARAEIGAKRWDVNVVLLTPDMEPLDTETGQMLHEIAYNTLGVRRLVQLRVAPTLFAVERALRSFLPLRLDMHADVLGDALADLERELPKHGIPDSEAVRLVASYRTTGRLHGS